ncbi:MAG: cation transporter [Chitinophagaceae bacterium]
MKSLKIFSLVLLMASTFAGMAQDLKTETIPVSGNCGMCKSNIEKAAKTAGVSEANWDQDKKILTIKYNETTTSVAKVQQGVAAAGYDTRDVRATDASYKKLHACCQYDRTEKGDKGPKGDKGDKSVTQVKSDLTSTSASCCSKGGGAENGSAEKAKACCAKGGNETTSTEKAKACCNEGH